MTLIQWVEDVFGVYTPITYNDGTADIIPAGMAGINWQYLTAVAVFLVITVCVFKLLGALIKK